MIFCLDIRVYKGYLFVQYENINDAKRLIKQGENSLFLKGNKLDEYYSLKKKGKDFYSSF